MKKQAAKDEIDQLQAVQTAINNDQNATNEEKAAIQQLATAVTDAKITLQLQLTIMG